MDNLLQTVKQFSSNNTNFTAIFTHQKVLKIFSHYLENMIKLSDSKKENLKQPYTVEEVEEVINNSKLKKLLDQMVSQMSFSNSSLKI